MDLVMYIYDGYIYCIIARVCACVSVSVSVSVSVPVSTNSHRRSKVCHARILENRRTTKMKNPTLAPFTPLAWLFPQFPLAPLASLAPLAQNYNGIKPHFLG
jgi:hypothetical protein